MKQYNLEDLKEIDPVAQGADSYIVVIEQLISNLTGKVEITRERYFVEKEPK